VRPVFGTVGFSTVPPFYHFVSGPSLALSPTSHVRSANAAFRSRLPCTTILRERLEPLRWNGTRTLTTTFVSATQLTSNSAIASADFAGVLTFKFTVG